jgi:hypothetical protein
MEQESISWGELADLTHATQVARFNFCMCEDNESGDNPYPDCPRECIQCFNMYSEPDNREDTCDFCQGNLRRR